PEGAVQPHRAGRDDGDLLLHLILAHPHHRALPELLLDGGARAVQRLQLLADRLHDLHSGSLPANAPATRRPRRKTRASDMPPSAPRTDPSARRGSRTTV